MLTTTLARQLRLTTLSPTLPPPLRLRGARRLATLAENPYIYIHPHPIDPTKKLLSLLATTPPTTHLAIGTADALPLTPRNFTPNPHFLPILSAVFAEHARHDPHVQSQASVYASPGGSFLAENYTGAANAGHGGWIHISDLRNPPDYGRIAWPEDIFGSVEVDGSGAFSGGNGAWQDSGTYRMVTREGVLGLTDFMRAKMVERLLELEKQVQQNS